MSSILDVPSDSDHHLPQLDKYAQECKLLQSINTNRTNSRRHSFEPINNNPITSRDENEFLQFQLLKIPNNRSMRKIKSFNQELLPPNSSKSLNKFTNCQNRLEILKSIPEFNNFKIGELFRAFLLANIIQTFQSKKSPMENREKHFSETRYLTSLLAYTSSIGYTLQWVSKQIYDINFFGDREQYELIYYQTLTNFLKSGEIYIFNQINVSNGEIFRISLTEAYLKTSDMRILEFIYLGDQNIHVLKQYLKYQLTKGIKFIFFAKKFITEFRNRDIRKFKITITNDPPSESYQDEDKVDFLNLSLKQFSFMGILCIGNQLNEGSEVLIESLGQIGIQQMMISADCKIETLTTCFQSNLINSQQIILQINDDNIDGLRLQIKNYYRLLYQNYSKKDSKEEELKVLSSTAMKESQNRYYLSMQTKYIQKKKMTSLSKSKQSTITDTNQNTIEKVFNNYVILCNGQTIPIIMNDKVIWKHFIFLSLLVKNFVGYNFSSTHKKAFISALQKMSSNELNIISFGSSFKDIDSFNFSRVNVGFKKNQSLLLGSFQIQKFTDLQQFFSCQYKSRVLTVIYCLASYIGDFFWLKLIQMVTCMMLLECQEVILQQNEFWIFTTIFLMFHCHGILVSTNFMDIEHIYFHHILLSRRNQRQIIYGLFQFVAIPFVNGIITSFIFSNLIQGSFITFTFVRSILISQAIFYQSGKILPRIVCPNNRDYITHILIQFFLIIFFLLMISASQSDNFNDVCSMLLISQYWLLHLSTFFLSLFGYMITFLIYSPTFIDQAKINKINFNNRSKRLVQIFRQLFRDIKIDEFLKKSQTFIFQQLLVFENQNQKKLDSQELNWILDFKNEKLAYQCMRDKIETFNRVTIVYIFFFTLLTIKYLFPQFPYFGEINNFFSENLNYIIIILIVISILYFYTVFIKRFIEKNKEVLHYQYQLIVPIFIICTMFLEVFYQQNNEEEKIALLDLHLAKLQFYKISYYIIYYKTSLPLSLLEQIIFHSKVSKNWSNVMMLNSLILSLSYFILSVLIQYQNEKYHKTTILFQHQQQQAQDETNKILQLLLPKFILNTMDNGITDFELNQGEVVVFFAEITNFEAIAKKQQRHIITFLDEVYRQFDKICLNQQAMKIETVGKVYMASLGLKFKQHKIAKLNKCLAGLNLAFDMMNLVQETFFGRNDLKDLKQKIQIKIGMHYGRVLAGVIGFHKPQFSLIGDTVNTTSRVCSNSETGQILISQAFYEEVKDSNYLFVSKTIQAKGKGNLQTYRVMQRNSSNKRLISKDYIQLNTMNDFNDQFEESENTNQKLTMNLNRKPKNQKLKTSIKRIPQKKSKKGILFVRSKSEELKPSNENNKLDQRNFINPELEFLELDPVKSFTVQKRNRNSILKRSTSLIFQFTIGKQISQKDRLNQLLYGDLKKNYQSEDESRLFLNEWTLEFTNKSDEDYIEQFLQQKTIENYAISSIVLTILSLFWITRNFYKFFFSQENQVLFYLKLTIDIIILCYILLNQIIVKIFNSQVKRKNFNLVFFFLMSTFKVILSNFTQIKSYIHFDLLEQIQYFDIQLSYLSFSFMENLVTILINCIFWIILLIINRDYDAIFFVIYSFLILVFKAYNKRINDVYQFIQTTHLSTRKYYKDTLVQNLLPNHILTRFYADNTIKFQLSDFLDDVTILFADIAGFTAYSAQVQPEQVLNMLRSLFTEFDKECCDYNVYKVYTIGDCYVILGMNDLNRRNPAEEAKNVLLVAFKMLQIIQIVRDQVNFDGLHMRIGIHTGECFGGVIGTDVVRYDLYGEAVTIANKMESYGLQGRIHISETTKQIIEQFYSSEFSFEQNQEISFPQYEKSLKSYFVYQNQNE